MGQPTYHPGGVIRIVQDELARRAVKTSFSGAEMQAAMRPATELLQALGVAAADTAEVAVPETEQQRGN